MLGACFLVSTTILKTQSPNNGTQQHRRNNAESRHGAHGATDGRDSCSWHASLPNASPQHAARVNGIALRDAAPVSPAVCLPHINATFSPPSKNPPCTPTSELSVFETMSGYQGQAQPHYVLTVTQTKYICRERELNELLVRHFGQGIDFNISVC